MERLTENGSGSPVLSKTGMNGRSLSGAGVEEGGYHFDRMALPGPFAILGFDLGYRSGPLMAESAEEREGRHSHVVELPEEDGTERRAS